MHVLIFLEHLSKVINVVFKVSSLVSILTMKVSIALLVLDLLLNILFMKSDYTLLKFLEVCNVMQAFEDVILELLLELFLFVELVS